MAATPPVSVETVPPAIKLIQDTSADQELPWSLQMLLNYPDERVRVLAHAGLEKIRQNDLETGELFLDWAVEHMEM